MNYIDTSYRRIWVHPRKKAPTVQREGFELYDVYKRPSWYKVLAYRNCREMCHDLDGGDFAITQHSCQAFTVSFIFAHPNTGELMRAVITSRNADAYYL